MQVRRSHPAAFLRAKITALGKWITNIFVFLFVKNPVMKTILITGANGNLGQVVSRRLLDDGFRLLAVEGLAGTGKLPEHENIEVSELDLSDEMQVRDYIGNILQKEPDILAAVLLAGGFAMGKITETGKESLNRMIDLNFYTAYNLVKPLFEHFLGKARGGQFIFIGSRPGLNPADGKDFFAYTLSKSMLFRLAEVINAEGKDKGVSATVIVPSTIDTAANRKAMPGADFSKWVPPSNIADAISFCLTDTGRMLRDQVIRIYNNS